MQEKDLTPWFVLSEQEPWEAGVYEVFVSHDSSCFTYWDGLKFNYAWTDFFGDAAIGYAHDSKRSQRQVHWFPENPKWRGLSTNPEKPKRVEKKQKTMHIAMQHQVGFRSSALGSFESKKLAEKCADWHRKNIEFAFHKATYTVQTIRFRTPE